MGLKHQYPILAAGGTRGPKVHKMAFEGFLTRIFTLAKGLNPQSPLLRPAESEDPRCIKWHLRVPYSYFYNWRRV
ncbi:Hypothetical protein FKW44_009874 [Caligus rogercresseyi]|uniref:Uncharacterized protein n=1 Tax=Caligus rogercresseyi TaxID=217165 RepID=A0A7T8HFU8_CALRO|nr:Hypothetical protein FKW44_009874 [Caligus rogercresseyi]